MLQTGVSQFATGGQVEVLEFDQAGQNWQPSVWTKQEEEIKMKLLKQNWYPTSLETPGIQFNTCDERRVDQT